MLNIGSKIPFQKRLSKVLEGINSKFFGNMHPNINEFLVDSSIKAEAFGHTQKYLINLRKIEKVEKLFDTWTEDCQPHEKDLFVVRFVLV